MLKEPKHFKCWSNSWKYARVATSFTSFMRTWCSSPNGEERCSTPLASSAWRKYSDRSAPTSKAVLKEFNGEPDHVHLLVNYPPKVRLSELVNSLKGVSSRRMKQEFPAISTFWSVRKSKGHLWSPSYFVGSVGGAPITILRQYIEGQNRSFGRCTLNPGPKG